MTIVYFKYEAEGVGDGNWIVSRTDNRSGEVVESLVEASNEKDAIKKAVEIGSWA
jgi:hypothetical protein